MKDDDQPTGVFTLTNGQPDDVRVRLEPWADERVLAPGSMIEIAYSGPPPAALEIESRVGSIKVYGWVGAVMWFSDESSQVKKTVERAVVGGAFALPGKFRPSPKPGPAAFGLPEGTVFATSVPIASSRWLPEPKHNVDLEAAQVVALGKLEKSLGAEIQGLVAAELTRFEDGIPAAARKKWAQERAPDDAIAMAKRAVEEVLEMARRGVKAELELIMDRGLQEVTAGFAFRVPFLESVTYKMGSLSDRLRSLLSRFRDRT